MKKNLLSLNALVLVALASFGVASPALAAAAPSIPAMRSYLMHPDGGVVVADERTGRVLLVNPSGETRYLVGAKAGVSSPSAVGIRKGFLYVQDAQAIYKVLPDLHSLTSRNARFQLVQTIYGSDQPFVKLTSPSSESRFSKDETVTIAWAHNLGKSALFTIELSRDNCETWETLAESVKGNRYTWYATFPKTDAARLRIRQVAGPLSDSGKPSTDTTDEVFFLLSPPE